MSKFSRFFWLISAILMIVGGLICFFNPGVVLLSLAWILGVVVFVDGISTVCYFFSGGREHKGAGWLLFDGIVSILLGGIVIFSNMFVAIGAMLPIFFSIWIICKGIMGILHSFEIKNIGWSSWWILLLIGSIIIALGIVSLIHPLVTIITISVLVGLFFVISGVFSIVQWFSFGKLMEYLELR